MNKEKHQSQAMEIIERWRAPYGAQEAFSAFVYYWATAHTGLYHKESALYSDDKYMGDVSELANLLTEAMLSGYTDPLGDLLLQLGINTHKKSPVEKQPESSELLGHLMGLEENEVYEPFAGTGRLAMDQMLAYCQKYAEKNNPLGEKSFILEEVKPLNCAASVIQIFHKLEYLSKTLNKGIIPKELKIRNLDVLTREEGEHHYIARQMSDSEVIKSQLSEQESAGHIVH